VYVRKGGTRWRFRGLVEAVMEAFWRCSGSGGRSHFCMRSNPEGLRKIVKPIILFSSLL